MIDGGYGRVTADDLRARRFVIVEREEAHPAEARNVGCLVHQGDAADEEVLYATGVTHSGVLASILQRGALSFSSHKAHAI